MVEAGFESHCTIQGKTLFRKVPAEYSHVRTGDIEESSMGYTLHCTVQERGSGTVPFEGGEKRIREKGRIIISVHVRLIVMSWWMETEVYTDRDTRTETLHFTFTLTDPSQLHRTLQARLWNSCSRT